MGHFAKGFTSELEKIAEPVSSAILGMLGGKVLANAAIHSIMNTRLTIPPVRKFLERAGDEFFLSGIRHGISGKKMGHVPSALIGTLATPSGPYMYGAGRKYGDTLRRAIEKAPLIGASAPFKAIRGADTAVTEAMRAAPVAGAATGAGYGYMTGRTKKEDMPLKSILAGALVGGLLGKAVSAAGPHAPVISQLKKIRKNVADPVIEGSQSGLGKFLDLTARIP